MNTLVQLGVRKTHCARENLRGGNLAFQAPEVLNAIARNDETVNFAGQYSWEVGCLIYKRIAGEFPFAGYPDGLRKLAGISVGPLAFGTRFGVLKLKKNSLV